jgi:hypothetical protein
MSKTLGKFILTWDSNQCSEKTECLQNDECEQNSGIVMYESFTCIISVATEVQLVRVHYFFEHVECLCSNMIQPM